MTFTFQTPSIFGFSIFFEYPAISHGYKWLDWNYPCPATMELWIGNFYTVADRFYPDKGDSNEQHEGDR